MIFQYYPLWLLYFDPFLSHFLQVILEFHTAMKTTKINPLSPNPKLLPATSRVARHASSNRHIVFRVSNLILTVVVAVACCHFFGSSYTWLMWIKPTFCSINMMLAFIFCNAPVTFFKYTMYLGCRKYIPYNVHELYKISNSLSSSTIYAIKCILWLPL